MKIKQTKTRKKNEEKLKKYIESEYKFSNSSDKSSGPKPQAG